MIPPEMTTVKIKNWIIKFHPIKNSPFRIPPLGPSGQAGLVFQTFWMLYKNIYKPINKIKEIISTKKIFQPDAAWILALWEG